MRRAGNICVGVSSCVMLGAAAPFWLIATAIKTGRLIFERGDGASGWTEP